MTGSDEGWTKQTFTGSAIGSIRCNSSSVGCTKSGLLGWQGSTHTVEMDTLAGLKGLSAKSGLLGWQGSVHTVEIDMLAGFTGVYTESGLSC